jgi:thymidylate kinase
MSPPSPTDPVLTIAIEAPSDSGKSTLAKGLERRLANRGATLLSCYVEVAGGDANVPAARAETAEEQRAQLRGFLEIEAARARQEHAVGRRIVILDRSVHSLLAHAYAEERSGGPAAFDSCRSIVLQAADVIWPDLVLLLDVSEENRRARMKPGDEGKWFTDPDFNRMFSEYFTADRGVPMKRVVTVDGNGSREDLVEEALAVVEDALQGGRQ